MTPQTGPQTGPATDPLAAVGGSMQGMVAETGQDLVPVATPAAPDLICWLWAAFTPYRGRLNVSAVARELRRGRHTVREWIRTARGTTIDPQLAAELSTLALDRGEGAYLWPDIDPMTRNRIDREAHTAHAAHAAITAGSYPEGWAANGTLDSHEVLLVHWPDAMVYGVNITATTEHRAKINRRPADIIQTVHAPNKYAAQMIKHHLLATHTTHRCIAPARLVTYGRTETWRETAGSGRLVDSVNRIR